MKLKSKKFRLKAVNGKGVVTAVIATLNVKDHDGDVTLPGAFGEQEAVIVPGHDWQHIPLGKARIYEDGDEALAELKFNLDSQAGGEWYKALKFDFENGQPLQEYSYSYKILDAEDGERNGEKVQLLKGLEVPEVGPVLLGAGIDTRTVAVKDRLRNACRFHLESKQIGGLSHRELERELAHAIREQFGEKGASIWIEDIFPDTAVFEKYFYEGEGEGGLFRVEYSVSKKTVSVGEELTEVRREVRFVERDNGGKSLIEEFENLETALAAVGGFKGRIEALAALKAKDGRTLSKANRDRLGQLLETLSGLKSELGDLLSETEPPDRDLGASLYAQYQKMQFDLQRHMR